MSRIYSQTNTLALYLEEKCSFSTIQNDLVLINKKNNCKNN